MRPIPGQMPASALRVLVCVLQAADRGEVLTVRDIMKRLGFRSTNAVAPVLVRLRAEGLATWQEDAGHGSGRPANRTPRPACRLALYKEALP